MANINLPAATWVDLYATSGITAGQKIGVTNTGPWNIYVSVNTTAPATSPQGNGNPTGFSVEYPAGTVTGSNSLWAFSFHDNPIVVANSLASAMAAGAPAMSVVDKTGAALPLLGTGGSLNVESGAGQHTYGYTNGLLTTDTWVYNGVTRVKTYAYTNGVLTSETDWV